MKIKDNEVLGKLFDEIAITLSTPENFSIPRIYRVMNQVQLDTLDLELIDAILEDASSVDTATNSHELIGVDFVFSNYNKYELFYPKKKFDKTLGLQLPERLELQELSTDSIKNYAINNNIDDILNIKVTFISEDTPKFSKPIKEILEYTSEDENIILNSGHWYKFNEEYIAQLNSFVDEISIENDSALINIPNNIAEPAFNDFAATQHGYTKADKNFKLIVIKGAPSIEAYDLLKDGIPYAVKFGTPQKMNYVFNQAILVINAIQSKANKKKFQKMKKYCVWLVFENRKNTIQKLSEINSVMFKQSLDEWRRKCHNAGIEPLLRISYKND